MEIRFIPLSGGKTLIGGNGPPYVPMAPAIIGGLIFSTVVTLIILPTIYVLKAPEAFESTKILLDIFD